MSNSRKILGAFALALCISLITPFAIPFAPTNTSTVEAAKVKISKKKATLLKGQELTLKLKNNSKKLKWTTSNKKIATVNSKGKVKAKKAGVVTITAKVGKKKYECTVTVIEPLGTKENPISAYNSNTVKMFDILGQKETFKITLTKYLEGAETDSLVPSYNKDIPPDYVWVYMEFDTERKSDNLLMNLFWETNFYDSKCKTKLYRDYMITSLANTNTVRPITDVDPYMLYHASFYIMCAVPKSALPLTFNLRTGYNKKTAQSTYTWYTTKK